jgi:putative ABC transport system ATP-binding protein
MGILKNLNQTHGLTIVVVTHSDEVARFASRIVTFRDGRIVGDTPRQVSLAGEPVAAGPYARTEISS